MTYRVVQRTFKLDAEAYEIFKQRSKDEGYTIDEAINILIRGYVDNEISGNV